MFIHDFLVKTKKPIFAEIGLGIALPMTRDGVGCHISPARVGDYSSISSEGIGYSIVIYPPGFTLDNAQYQLLPGDTRLGN